MPKFTVTLTTKHLSRLQKVVDTYNANSGQTLTVGAWILLHLKDVVITEDLAANSRAITEAHQRDAEAGLSAAVTAERDRLLTEL